MTSANMYVIEIHLFALSIPCTGGQMKMPGIQMHTQEHICINIAAIMTLMQKTANIAMFI